VVIVTDNIVSSFFNSHLFDFTQAWLYIFGVGAAGGVALRNRNAGLSSAGYVENMGWHRAPHEPDTTSA
jgi:hypothetical protein